MGVNSAYKGLKKKLDNYLIAAFECVGLTLCLKLKTLSKRWLFQLEVLINLVQ
jgi:hypothetical protein